jgi:hypothetical protein
MSDNVDDWDRHKEKVFFQLKTFSEDIEKIRDDNHFLKLTFNQKLLELSIELAKLQIKSTIWGAAAGVLGALSVYMLRK